MGQGVRIVLTNRTPYQWIKTYYHSHKIDGWDSNFPSAIAPGATIVVYVEFRKGAGIHADDDAGEVDYTLDGTNGLAFQIQGRHHSEAEILIWFKNLATLRNSKNSTMSLGHERKKYAFLTEQLYVNFILAGNVDGFISMSRKQDNADWMKFIDGNKKISALTIPGTHDTGTYTITEGLIKGLPNEVLQVLSATLGILLGPFLQAIGIFAGGITPAIIANSAQCQTMNLDEQLSSGIRFLDIRLKKDGNKLELYHGGIRLHINFDEILNICYHFLDRHSSETIIMLINNENSGDNPPIADMVKTTINRNPSHWHTGQTIPDLKDVRKKIVLVRRYASDTKIGINIKQWSNSFKNEDGVDFIIQDEYKSYVLGQLDKKFLKHVEPCLQKAEADAGNNTLFLNFASGTGGVYPQTVANGYLSQFKGTNGMLFDYMSRNVNNKHYGIIPMDYPETPYSRALISQLISRHNFVVHPSAGLANNAVYELRPRFAGGNCLDVNGGRTVDNTEVIIHKAKNGNNQRWKLEDAGDGYYFLHPQNAPGKVLEVKGFASANSSSTVIFTKKTADQDNQKWRIEPLGDNYFSLKPKFALHMALEVFGANAADGQKATIYQANGSFAQQWRFQKMP
jgi:1-phosphatidylinositol phosphodiesterase